MQPWGEAGCPRAAACALAGKDGTRARPSGSRPGSAGALVWSHACRSLSHVIGTRHALRYRSRLIHWGRGLNAPTRKAHCARSYTRQQLPPQGGALPCRRAGCNSPGLSAPGGGSRAPAAAARPRSGAGVQPPPHLAHQTNRNMVCGKIDATGVPSAWFPQPQQSGPPSRHSMASARQKFGMSDRTHSLLSLPLRHDLAQAGCRSPACHAPGVSCMCRSHDADLCCCAHGMACLGTLSCLRRVLQCLLARTRHSQHQSKLSPLLRSQAAGTHPCYGAAYLAQRLWCGVCPPAGASQAQVGGVVQPPQAG